MTTTSIGRQAESAVEKYLSNRGYKILAQNWRSRLCEIDLVALKEEVIFIVEVKYRSTDKQGSGLDYITAAKQKQMTLAGHIWTNDNQWLGDWRLLAASVVFDGQNYSVENLIELS